MTIEILLNMCVNDTKVYIYDYAKSDDVFQGDIAEIPVKYLDIEVESIETNKNMLGINIDTSEY